MAVVSGSKVKRSKLSDPNDSVETYNLLKRKWLKVASSSTSSKITIRVMQFNVLADGESYLNSCYKC